jgi:cell division transport system permease protein
MKRTRHNRHRSTHHWSTTLRRMLSPHTWLTRHAQVALHSLGRLYRNPLATLMTAAVIGIALAMPAYLYLLLNNMDRLSSAWDGPAGLSVFLKKSLPEAAVGKLASRVRGWPEVAEVTLVTPDQALEEFRHRSGFADVLDTLDENPLPAVLLVLPAPEQADPQSAANLQDKLQALPETEQAQLDLQWVQRLTAMLALAQRGVLLISALLALAVLLVVGNTIRLEIQGRREEIVVTRLIGATDGFIRRPFLYSGTWYGVIGAVLAWLLVEAGFWLLDSPVRQLANLYQSSFQLQTLPVLLLFGLLAGGILLGLLGSWIAVGRHLGAIEPG